jgi:hypothetical protein
MLNVFKISYELKEKIYSCICNANNLGAAICELQTIGISSALLGAISEFLFA